MVNQDETQKETKRTWYFDFLRVLSCYGVILLHTISAKWGAVKIESSSFSIMMIYETFTRIAVPIFIMLSGALFLGKKISLKRLWKHNIRHLIVFYFVWTLVLNLIDSGITHSEVKIENVFNWIANGYWHLWFIAPMIGTYMLYPLLKLIT